MKPRLRNWTDRFRQRPVVAGIAIACVALAASGLLPSRPLRAQQEKAGDAAADASRNLVERQRELSLRALDLIAKSINLGAPVIASSEDTILWSNKLLGCRLYLSFGPGEMKTQDPEVYLSLAKGPPNPARIAAFDDHYKRTKVVEERYLPLYQRGDFSAFNFARIESSRLQAEIWLSRERNRQ